MSRSTIVTSLVIIVLIIAGLFFFSARNSASTAEIQNSADVTASQNSLDASVTPSPSPSTPSQSSAKTVTVTYTDSGFSPSSVTINVGDTVAFKNNSSSDFWPATANHPAHTVYDGTNLQAHCAAGATPSFDACTGVAPGSSYSFTFTKAGTWGYHDHLNARNFGKVVVQ